MTIDRFELRTHYSGSRALIIGIDDYAVAPPLSYAVSDANGVARALIDGFGFPAQDVVVLTNEVAVRDNIRGAFLAFAAEDVGRDERIVFFFAGHGYTVPGNAGEVGFLVPQDGHPNDLSSLIRWDDLTRSADLIPAKHVLFIIDACYGGLAFSRSSQSGSTRFLKDMLKRTARQAIAAGKANETVSDAGGPIPGHSVFTGHLIEGLNGNAASSDGVITAQGLMAYVYRMVGMDRNCLRPSRPTSASCTTPTESGRHT